MLHILSVCRTCVFVLWMNISVENWEHLQDNTVFVQDFRLLQQSWWTVQVTEIWFRLDWCTGINVSENVAVFIFRVASLRPPSRWGLHVSMKHWYSGMYINLQGLLQYSLLTVLHFYSYTRKSCLKLNWKFAAGRIVGTSNVFLSETKSGALH